MWPHTLYKTQYSKLNRLETVVLQKIIEILVKHSKLKELYLIIETIFILTIIDDTLIYS